MSMAEFCCPVQAERNRRSRRPVSPRTLCAAPTRRVKTQVGAVIKSEWAQIESLVAPVVARGLCQTAGQASRFLPASDFIEFFFGKRFRQVLGGVPSARRLPVGRILVSSEIEACRRGNFQDTRHIFARQLAKFSA